MRKFIMAVALILAMISASTFALAQGTECGTADVTPERTVEKAAENTDDDKYTDISKHWAKESIKVLAKKEILDIFASSDGKFYPDKAITRREFVLILHKALDIQITYFRAPDIREIYDDMNNEDICASALCDLVTTGIIDYKGQFKPDSTLTREDMIHFIINAYRYKMGDNYRQIKLPSKPFADDDEINPVYSGNIARAEYEGLIVRPASNKFYPKDLATRAQVVTITDRLLRLLEKENSKLEEQVQVVPSAELKDGVLYMKLSITNGLQSQIVINHNSGQKFDFTVLDSDRNELYRWSADKMFIMALTKTVIEPGKSVEFSAEVEKDFFSSFKDKAKYVKSYITGTSKDFKINAEGYEVEIK